VEQENGSMSRTPTPDFLVIGGGVIGLRLALEARTRHPDASVTLLEKEERCGLHASGRNSGVLHAGFYYSTDSLKARFTVAGNRALKEYCRERGLRLNECGKLVVARDDSELAGLDELLRRGRANGVELEMMSEADARRIEPRVKTAGRALWSPSTATVDPREVVERLVRDAEAAGVDVRTGCRFLGCAEGVPAPGRFRVRTSRGTLEPGYVINAAGLYADVVARDFGFGECYRMLPFKGLYLHSSEPAGALRTNLYPVPDLKKPFLGVHFTMTVDGRAKIGPTAVPALWREHYRGLENFDAGELTSVVSREAKLFLTNAFGFRDLALDEVKKYRKKTLVGLASAMATGVRPADYTEWGRPGIRAQLLDTTTDRLVMDFVHEGDDRSFHVLNAVSPGFTCSFPFASYLFEQIEGLAG